MSAGQLAAVALEAVTVDLIPAVDVRQLPGMLAMPGGAPMLTAGHPAPIGPGPRRVADLPVFAAGLLVVLDGLYRELTGAPLRVRMPTLDPAEDGLILAGYTHTYRRGG
jgi:hypothetical protein